MKLKILLALLALAITALACGSSAASGPPTITETHLFRDNGSGEAGDEVSTFSPSDRNQHFEAKLNNLVSGHVKWVFTAVDTTEGQNIEITTVETDVTRANDLIASLSLPNDWPTGSYKAEIYLDDSLLGTLNYSVQ